jgi:uncharacterized protein YjbJ (UPF0337 family)
MDWEQIRTEWQQHRGELRQRWDRLSDRELDEISGDRKRLAERLRQTYGISVGDAEREISDWQEQLADWDPSSADGPPPMQPGSSAHAVEASTQVPPQKLVDAGAWPDQPADEPGVPGRTRPSSVDESKPS